MLRLMAWKRSAVGGRGTPFAKSARALLVGIYVAAIAGCSADAGLTGVNGDNPPDVAPDLSAAGLAAVSGQEQMGVVGSVLPDPLVVEVIASDGAPIEGAPVQWVFSAGRGLTDADTPSGTRAQVVRMETDAEGKAQIWWELGTRRGLQIATVSIVEPETASGGSGAAGAPGGKGKGKRLGLIAQAQPGPASNIVVTPDPASVEVQGTLRLEAVVTDTYGNVIEGAEVVWRSSDAAVATVDATGLLQPTAPGGAIVTASSGDITDDATVTVMSEPSTDSTAVPVPNPDQVTDLSASSVSTSAVTLRWTAVDDGTGSGASYALRVGSPSVSWGSADSLQVLVDGTALRPGAVHEYIWSSLDSGTTYEFQVVAYRGSIEDGTAMFSQLSSTASAVTAEEAPAPDGGSEPLLGTLELSPSSAVITGVGGTHQFQVTARDSLGNIISPLIAWESLDPSVATVTSTGLVTAQALGTALIVVAASCCSSDTAQVQVQDPIPLDGLLLHTNWTTATGNSVAAVGDGGKGIMQWCDWQQVLSVVDGPSVGLPAGLGNALSIRSIQNCGHVEYENVFPRPTNDQEQFWAVRYYAMNGAGQTDTKMHPHTFWPVGSIEAVHLGITPRGSGGDWVMHPRWTFSGDEFPFGVWPKAAGAGQPLTVAAGTWVRYEFILHWRNATQFRWYPRVYDMNGSLLWDEYDFRHTDTNLSLGDWYDASPSNVLTRASGSSGQDNIRTFAFGMGQAGSSGGRYYIADAAFALVSGPTAFIGAGAP